MTNNLHFNETSSIKKNNYLREPIKVYYLVKFCYSKNSLAGLVDMLINPDKLVTGVHVKVFHGLSQLVQGNSDLIDENK